MKKILLLLLMTVSFASVAAEYQAEWIEPLAVRKNGQQELTPADPKADVKNLRRTAFYVDCNEYGIMFTIRLDENDAKARNEVELFFAPEGCTSYYQFYGFPFEKNMTSYPYGTYSRLHPRLQRKNWQISYQMTPAGMTLRVLVDWKDFARFVNTKNWKVGVFRSRNYQSQFWQGKLHEPATWGTVVFPEFTPDQKEAIAKRIVTDFAADEDHFKFDPARYNNRTFAAWRETAKKQLAAMLKDEKMTWCKKLEIALDLMETRRFLDNPPYSIDPKKPAWTFYKGAEKQEKIDWRGPFQFNAKENVTRSVCYTAPADSEGEVWITNFVDYTKNEKVKWRVERDGKTLHAGNSSMQPLNLKIGAMKKGDSFQVVYEQNGTSYKPEVRFAVEDLKHGMIPGPAVCTDRPGAYEPAPKRNPDGTTETGYESRIVGHLNTIHEMCKKGTPPRIYFLGDSITDGLRGKGWSMIKHLRPVNLGISGDWTQNVRWRLDQGLFDECKPELVVLMIGTNNGRYTIEEVAKGNKMIMDRIHELSPDTKILLLGIFPRGHTFPPGCRLDKINDILKTYADNEKIFYMDLAHVFIDKDRNVRKDLLPDRLHPGSAGNVAWMTAILPTLEKLLSTPAE